MMDSDEQGMKFRVLKKWGIYWLAERLNHKTTVSVKLVEKQKHIVHE
jgi:hypothetical protein